MKNLPKAQLKTSVFDENASPGHANGMWKSVGTSLAY